jgi:hypothetical protein
VRQSQVCFDFIAMFIVISLYDIFIYLDCN